MKAVIVAVVLLAILAFSGLVFHSRLISRGF
jgi:hypothetical protein